MEDLCGQAADTLRSARFEIEDALRTIARIDREDRRELLGALETLRIQINDLIDAIEPERA